MYTVEVSNCAEEVLYISCNIPVHPKAPSKTLTPLTFSVPPTLLNKNQISKQTEKNTDFIYILKSNLSVTELLNS